MKRTTVNLGDIASLANLVQALHEAAKGKRCRSEVKEFFKDQNLEKLQDDLFQGSYKPQPMTSFIIHDPKKRCIHAPSFRDRVVHHALINIVGPVLDKVMIDNNFACRKGKDTIAAVKKASENICRFSYFSKMDIRTYFDSIPHEKLKTFLRRVLKGEGLFLLEKIIDSYHTLPGKGLPIGALTSQHLANFYLTRADRFILQHSETSAYLRYMDDMVLWSTSSVGSRKASKALCEFIESELLLKVKANSTFNRSSAGLSFCGYRLYPGKTRLGKRRYRQFKKRHSHWQNQYKEGHLSELELQRNSDALSGMVSLCHPLHSELNKINEWYEKS